MSMFSARHCLNLSLAKWPAHRHPSPPAPHFSTPSPGIELACGVVTDDENAPAILQKHLPLWPVIGES
jgi:hypothetical protein